MMRFTANVCCTDSGRRLWALRDKLYEPLDRERHLSEELTFEDLALLELFSQMSDPADVFLRLDGQSHVPDAKELRDRVERHPKWQELCQAAQLRLFVGKRALVAIPAASGADSVDPRHAVDLSPLSAEDPRVAIALFSKRVNRVGAEPGTLSDFATYLGAVKRLSEAGLLTPDVGRINWGDLRRTHPFCQAFGYMRGTPIDRFYLNEFLSEIRPSVTGQVLEIGGKKVNQQIYGFNQADAYRTLELPGIADDIEGDAMQRDCVDEGTFDTITAFHVLEHCEQPGVVVENMRHWLKPGGKAIVAVPSSQKIHSFPMDCWRPQPDGLRSMFSGYSDVRLHVYGNLTTVIAGLCGVSAEELRPEDRETSHPDYPVLSCAVATR